MKITDNNTLQEVRERGLKKLKPLRPRIAVGLGTCGIGNGAEDIFQALSELLAKEKLNARLVKTGCFGFCAEEPLVNVYRPDLPLLIFNRLTLKKIAQILEYAAGGLIPEGTALCKIESWDHLDSEIIYGKGFPQIHAWNELSFFRRQKKLVLRNCGLINPEDIEEYIAIGGYGNLYKALFSMIPETVIEELKKSGLRGRGGAGFPTWKKWELMRQAQAEKKYVICNADEGDPGAYMNRNEIESDPHQLLEGLLIAGFAMGAEEGIIYVRAEYPLAVARLSLAIKQAQEYGLLGVNIFNLGFNFKVTVVEGAGAFVCGEETALIASIEGQAGRPRPRPPYPAQKGLFGRPTTINNVETLCNVPGIIGRGGEWFAQTGTKTSAGTKVFSLVGKIKNTGLVEMPLGASLKTIIYDAGEGPGTGKKIVAVQTGGPSGGCIPAALFDTPVDYEALQGLGAIMGSGGMVVLDEDNCLVDTAKYFTEFTSSESCGKCVPCRIGLQETKKMLRDITEGKAGPDSLAELETLSAVIGDSAFCGLGQTAPNPVLTTLKYFRKEYEEHIKEKRCRAGICSSLFLAPCENSCPLHMNIPGFLELYKEKRSPEAYELILLDNPLPATTGRVCHHPCERRCRRAEIDSPISPGEVHRQIAEEFYKSPEYGVLIKRLVKEKLPDTGKKIAIVGAGPAGLTAAFYLVRLGHNVTVYEAHSSAGGMLEMTLPEFRLPNSVLQKELGLIKKLGVRFCFNKKIGVGVDVTVKELEDKYDNILLAVGAHKEISVNIPGEDLLGVFHGTGFLARLSENKKIRIGQKTVIVGGGNVALDAARTVVRLGAEATILYRREKEDLPANEEEIREAEEEGISFIFLSAPQKIIADGEGKLRGIVIEKMVAGEFDHSGRRKPVGTGKTYERACDSVILAVGEKPDSEFALRAGLLTKENGTVVADDFEYRTSNPKIFAAGDVVTGPATLSEAMGAGKAAAGIMDKELTGEDRFYKLFKKFVYKNIAPPKPAGKKKGLAEMLPARKRRNSFREVSRGLSKNKAENECIRCLRCDLKEENGR